MILAGQEDYPFEFSLHQKHASSPMLLELIWMHCLIVADIVEELFEMGTFDPGPLTLRFARQAALLHDIGVYRCGGYEWMPDEPPKTASYLQHLIFGFDILRTEGLDELTCRCAKNHTGVGLSADEISKHGLDLPQEDLLPQSELETLIAYAAKYHSKTPCFKSSDEIRTSLAQHGREKTERFDALLAQYGEPELSSLREKYDPWHKGFQYHMKELKAKGQHQYSSTGYTRL